MIKNRFLAKCTNIGVFSAGLLTIFWLDWSNINAISLNTNTNTLLWCLAWPSLVAIFTLFAQKRNQCRILGFSIILTALVTGIDSLYFYFFKSLPSLSVAQSMHQIWDVHYSIYMFLKPEMYIPLILGLVVLFLPRILGYQKKGDEKTSVMMINMSEGKMVLKQSHLVWPILISLLFVASSTIPWKASVAKSTVTEDTNWVENYSPMAYAAKYGLAAYHARDIYQFVSAYFGKNTISSERQQAVNRFLEHKQALNQLDSPLYGIAKGRNVVLLQMESWANYLLDLQIDGTEITPTINRIKNESLYFNNIYDVTLHGRSSDAEFAVLTGLLPDSRKPAQMSHMDSSFQSLPALLKQHGYHSNAVHGHERDFWNLDTAHQKYQIDESFFKDAFTGKQEVGLGINDEEVFQFAAEKLNRHKVNKIFSLVISLSSHHPFMGIPTKYNNLFATLRKEDGYGLIPNYLRSVKYSDDALAAFFDELKVKNNYNNTMFVIYGDHDPGHMGSHRLLKDVDMQALSNDRVPLLIHIPGKEKLLKQHQARFADVTGGLHDLMPTILHLLGIETPKGVVGTHLFVNNQMRDPIPLPSSPLNAAANASIIDVSHPAPNLNLREVFEQQLMVRDILDHNLLLTQTPKLSANN